MYVSRSSVLLRVQCVTAWLENCGRSHPHPVHSECSLIGAGHCTLEWISRYGDSGESSIGADVVKRKPATAINIPTLYV